MPTTVPENNLAKLLHGKLSGFNVPQLYLKKAGNYTAFHFENGFTPSININLGESASKWILIPFEEMQKLDPQKGVGRYDKSFWAW